MRKKYKKTLEQKVLDIDIQNIVTTEITYAELLFGVYNSSNPETNRILVQNWINKLTMYPLTRDAIDIYAHEKARLAKEGLLIADMDLLIASICIDKNFLLVTNNTKHFSRVKDIEIENWLA
jgi:predicted nucleic acid-binding protein